MNPISKIYTALREYRNHPVNFTRKNRAFFEYVFIQTAARIVPGEICVGFPNHTRLLVPPKMKGAAHYIAPRLCEFEDMAFTMHFLRPEDTFADVGANIGAFTVLAAGVVGSRVIAFEPNPETFASLTRNVRLNNIGQRVKLVNAAVGRAQGTIQMSTGLGTENHVTGASESAGAIQVEVTTLDNVLTDDPITFLKIDVEGFETEAFAGAVKILQNETLQAMLVERNASGNRYGFDEKALHQKIRDHGFQPFRYDAFTRTLFPSDGHTASVIIYIRNLEAANTRLKSAPPFHLDDLHV